MSESNREQLQWISDGLRDPDLLRDLGRTGFSLLFNIDVGDRALSGGAGVDPALVGSALVVDRMRELWRGVDDERLWGLILADLLSLVVDEWETKRRAQGPWKLVFDSHLDLGRSRGWTKRHPMIAQMVGMSTPELAQMNADIAAGRVNFPASKNGGCYIATAVYGSYDAPEVMTLRRYRDETLLRSMPGRALVGTYYAMSPPLAARLKTAPLANRAVRRVLDIVVKRVGTRTFVGGRASHQC